MSPCPGAGSWGGKARGACWDATGRGGGGTRRSGAPSVGCRRSAGVGWLLPPGMRWLEGGDGGGAGGLPSSSPALSNTPVPGGSVFPTGRREGCSAPRALGAQKPPVARRCWSRALPRPPARARTAGSAGDVRVAFCRHQGGDGVSPPRLSRCPVSLSQPRCPPDSVSVGSTRHDARDEGSGLRGLHGLNRSSAAGHHSHLRWLSPSWGPWAGQGCAEKVGCRARSSAAASQVTLALSWVTVFSVLVQVSWLIELKEQ